VTDELKEKTVSEEVPEEITEKLTEEIPVETPEEELTEEISEESPEEVAEEIPDEDPEEVTEEILDENPEEAAEDTSGSDDTAEEKSYGLTETAILDINDINARIEQRKKEKIVRVRKARLKTWGIISAVVIVAGLLIFSLSGYFTVDSIEVHGNSRFTSEEIINIAHASPGKNLIYNLDKEEIVEYLENNPYIKNAEVTRSFPSTLVITVEERKPLCALRYDDDYLIIDTEGVFLKKSNSEPKLTLVDGIVISKIEQGEKIEVKDQDTFDKAMKILTTMKKSDLYFVELDMSDEDEIKAHVYENLTVKMEYDQLIEVMENGKLHVVLEKLVADGIERGTITFADDKTASFRPDVD